MKKRIVRAVAALTVLATAGLSLELIVGGAGIAAADPVTANVGVQCQGVPGDNAGSIGGKAASSSDLVADLATFSGTAGLPALPIGVTANVPTKVKKGSGPFDVSFDYNIALPPSLVSQVQNTLHQNTIQIVNATVGVAYSGVASGELDTSIASQTIDLAGSGSTSVHIAGQIPSDTSGHLSYAIGTFNLGVFVNASATIGPITATIGTLTLTCSSGSPFPGVSTSIQVPGAPDTPGTIKANPVVGGNLGITPIIGRSDITPDDGNPILPDTLAVVSSANGAYVKNGALVQPTPNVGGLMDTTLQLCAPSRPVAAVPGKDQVQTLLWPTNYKSKYVNEHPLSMTLKWNGQETKSINLSTNVLGNTTLGAFQAPTAAALQAALAALPGVGAGNVQVTSITGGYSIEWTGTLGDNPQPAVELGAWNTWLDYQGYKTAQAVIAAAGAPTTTVVGAPPDPSATTLTLAQLEAAVASGKITSAQFSAQLGNAIVNSITAGLDPVALLAQLKQIYPQPPDLTGISQPGIATIPATETGPLCSQFDVQTQSVSLAFLAALDRLLHPQVSVLGCVTRRVKVRVKVHSHPTRYATRLVSRTTCPKKKVVKKVVKKKTTKR